MILIFLIWVIIHCDFFYLIKFCHDEILLNVYSLYSCLLLFDWSSQKQFQICNLHKTGRFLQKKKYQPDMTAIIPIFSKLFMRLVNYNLVLHASFCRTFLFGQK